MKNIMYVIKVTNNGKSFLYPCNELGSTVFLNISDAENTLNDLKNNKDCVVYPPSCTFEIMNKEDANDLFSYVTYNIKN
jgi:hypothetical protein